MAYDDYNREERALCFHLFRFMHENWSDNENCALFKLLQLVSTKDLKFENAQVHTSLSNCKFRNVAIYPEVAFIRDAFKNQRSNPNNFMDNLVALIKEQEGINACKLYSELPEILRNPEETHPGQIRKKALMNNIPLTVEELRVYGALQGMFNAKPDFAITIDNYLIAVEAKFTQDFDLRQLERTWNITRIWASPLLFNDLGFDKAPTYTVLKLGLSKYKPDISWQEIYRTAIDYYPESDRSLLAFKHALRFDQ